MPHFYFLDKSVPAGLLKNQTIPHRSRTETMILKLIMMFTIIPLLELYLLLQLAGYTDLVTTISVVILTGIIGAILTKAQGYAIYSEFHHDLAVGKMPHNTIIEGLCVLVGGALLLTPGLLTDAAGFALVLPPTRKLVCHRIKNYLRRRFQSGSVCTITINSHEL